MYWNKNIQPLIFNNKYNLMPSIECHYVFDFKKLKIRNKVGYTRSKEPFSNCLIVNRECTSINVISRLKALKSCDWNTEQTGFQLQFYAGTRNPPDVFCIFLRLVIKLFSSDSTYVSGGID